MALNYRRFRLPRTWSNNELRKIAHLFHGDIVNVSAGDNVDKEGGTYDDYFVNKTQYYITNYKPGSFRGFHGRVNEYLVDLVADLPPELERRFDVALNHTVLEHIFDVRTAFRNLCLLSKDIVIIVVPFAQEQHESESYYDYWRFMPNAVRRLFEENGLRVIYESHNDDHNTGIYLFFVGSRQPEKWLTLMPPYEPITNAGLWIGALKTIEDATVKESIRQLGRALRAKISAWLRRVHK